MVCASLHNNGIVFDKAETQHDLETSHAQASANTYACHATHCSPTWCGKGCMTGNKLDQSRVSFTPADVFAMLTVIIETVGTCLRQPQQQMLQVRHVQALLPEQPVVLLLILQ